MSIDDYILCVDDRSFEDAIDAIKSSSELILDCEGENLGHQGSSLSLISVRTIDSESSKTYLFDAISLTNDTLRPLFDILQSHSVTKIVFDGRMDFSELYHGRGVDLHNVLDLQLVDVDSRRQRGEDEDDQLARLCPYLHRQEIMGQASSYSKVQKLCGLKQCLQEHNKLIDDGEYKSGDIFFFPPSKKSPLTCSSVSHDSWLKRPLPEEYLCYAARDVYFIGRLYNHFRQGSYISDGLPDKSYRYVTIWRDAKPEAKDDFRCHGLLPLGVLDYHSHALTRSCVGCRRDLPEGAYSKSAWRGMSKRQCWVCRAISVKQTLHRDWDREVDERYESDDNLFGYHSDDGMFDSDDSF